MTLADLQRRLTAVACPAITVKPMDGAFMVEGGGHSAFVARGCVDDGELLETTVEVFLRGIEARHRMLSAPARYGGER